jgi:hypothetical protein
MAITTIGFLPGTDLGDLNSNWTPFSGDITPHSQEPDPTSHDLTGVPKSTGLNLLSEVLELNSVWHFKRISDDIVLELNSVWHFKRIP